MPCPGSEGAHGPGCRATLREAAYFARLNAVELAPFRTCGGVGEPRWSESAAGGPRR